MKYMWIRSVDSYLTPMNIEWESHMHLILFYEYTSLIILEKIEILAYVNGEKRVIITCKKILDYSSKYKRWSPF